MDRLQTPFVSRFVLVLLSCWVACSLAVTAPRLTREQAPVLAIPRMTVPPKIDGVIDATEWREAIAVSGVVDQGTDVLLPRPTTFFLAWDPAHFYFACRSYLKPGYKPFIYDGRSEGTAYCYDDGLELLFQPQGANVSATNRQTAFKCFLNCLGFSGDLTRLAVGQQLKNWAPHFQTATRLTAPGTAPGGGSWWEMEVSTVPADFELTGEHRAGDQWRLMFGINHLPAFIQARMPCFGGYFDPNGKCLGTLVEQTPAVQFTMDSLSNLASDGTASLAISAYNPLPQPAQLSIDLDVAGRITRQETLTLPAGGSGTFNLAEKLPAEVKDGTAHLRVTYREQPLLTYTAGFTVGQYDWMFAPVKPGNPNTFTFETHFNPVRNQLLVKADSYFLPDPNKAKALTYTVRDVASGTVVVKGKVVRVAEWYFQDCVPLPRMASGKYIVEASLEMADGQQLGPMQSQFEKKDEAKAFPEWWGKKIGDVERVLPPFTAITHKGNILGCWGRDYALNALGLPNAITAQQGAVLAAPARIIATVNGKETTIKLGALSITERKDWRIRFTGTATGAGLSFSASGWLEQDGLVYVELTYRPSGQRPVRVDALRIEYPLAEADADCLVCVGPGNNFSSKSTIVLPKGTAGSLWSTLVTGRTGSNMKIGSFYPTVWIGNDQRGFLWWADNDKGWFPDDAVPAHEAVRLGNAVVLRNNIIGKPVELDEPHTLAFSYMASPFKPLPQGWRMMAATEDGTFFQPFRGVRVDSKTGEKLWDIARGNINWINPESRYPEEWSKLWAEQKQQADASVRQQQPFDPYTARNGFGYQHMSFQLIGYGPKSIDDAVYAYFGEEWLAAGCDTWNDTYTDYAMYLFDRAFREGGVRSSYWDLSFPIPYTSILSGLSYRLPDGRVQPGYNGWNVRRFFMRLWALSHDYGLNPGAVGCHSTNAYIFVSLPWIDAILDGERNWDLDSSNFDWVDYYPSARLRAMSDPHNWGVGICWMSNFDTVNPDKVIAAKTTQAEYLWMHDSWRNPYLYPAEKMIRMPDSILDWGINSEQTVYHPYWRNPYVTCADPDVLVSLWQLPDRVMVGVFNTNRTERKDVTVKLDLAQLNLLPTLSWQQFVGVRDLYKGEQDPATQLDYYNHTLTLKGLRPHSARFIGVRKY